ncbi:phage protein Gp36 family protein [Polymorphobacter sp.]|uniref:phage protein Gp36 family protein n=1 Tax=Polymorphobacter sp. TaxID=1909290 RepID=UPI003F6E6756
MKIKQPFETLRVALAYGQPLASVSAVTIAPRGMVPGGTALTSLAPAIVGSEVRIDLLAGADGERYLITVQAAATAGDLLERETEVAVVDLAWAVPDLVTTYLTAQEFVDRLGLDQSIRITDTEGTGRIDAARLGKAIVDASAETEAYLAGRFATPLSVSSPLLAGIVFDLAVARLWIGEAPDSVTNRASAAVALLRDIAKGVVTLPGAALADPAVISATPVLTTEQTGAVFSRAKLSQF